MSRTEIAQDGAVIWSTLASPGRGLALVAERRRVLVALAAATLASLLFAAVAVPRVDFDRAAAQAIDARPREGDSGEMTPYQREEALAQARKVGALSISAGAALGPTLSVLGAALFLFLGFRLAGTRPGFRDTLAVSAHGLLPLFLAQLLAIPALLVKAPLQAAELPRLLPSSLAALLPAQASPVLAAALSSVDLFGLWALVLVALGMARVSGASRARAFTVTGVLWLAQLAFLDIAPAAQAAAARGGPGT